MGVFDNIFSSLLKPFRKSRKHHRSSSQYNSFTKKRRYHKRRYSRRRAMKGG